MFCQSPISFSARPVIFSARPLIGTVGPRKYVLQRFETTKLVVQQQRTSNSELYRAKRREMIEDHRAEQRQSASLQRRGINAEQVNRSTPTAIKDARKRTRRLAGDEDAAQQLCTEGSTINEILSHLIVKGPHHVDYPNLLQKLFDHLWKTCPFFKLLQRQVHPPTKRYAAFKSQIGWDWGKLVEVYRTAKDQAISLGTNNVVSVAYNVLTAFAGEVELVLDGYNATSDDMEGVDYTSSIDEGPLNLTEDVEMDDGGLVLESVHSTSSTQWPARTRNRMNAMFEHGFLRPQKEEPLLLSKVRSDLEFFWFDPPSTNSTSAPEDNSLFIEVNDKQVRNPDSLLNISELVAALSSEAMKDDLNTQFNVDMPFDIDEWEEGDPFPSRTTQWKNLACNYIVSARLRSITSTTQMLQHQVIRDFKDKVKELRRRLRAKRGIPAFINDPVIMTLSDNLRKAAAALV